jgi:hypothetical protein
MKKDFPLCFVTKFFVASMLFIYYILYKFNGGFHECNGYIITDVTVRFSANFMNSIANKPYCTVHIVERKGNY